MKEDEKRYKIYYHLFPNGKIYFGITKQPLKSRWANGHGYKTELMKNAINKYGWENIEHILYADNLTEQEAKNMETILITGFRTNEFQYGYNFTSGGDGTTYNDYSEVVKLFLLGKSRAQIAEITGYGWTSIDRYLKNNGYDSDILNANNAFSKPISRFDLDGNFIKIYKNRKEAVQDLGIKNSNKISEALHASIPRAHDSLWQLGEDNIYHGILPANKRIISRKKVGQYDDNWNLIAIYDSATQAAKAINKGHSRIAKVCREKTGRAYNYNWRYIENE